jgi:hypothetical protein
MGKRNRASNNPESPTVKIVMAIIGTVATITVALIGYFGAIKGASLPIEASQTAEALHTSLAMTANVSIPKTATNTPGVQNVNGATSVPTIPSLSTATLTVEPALTVEAVLIQLIDNYYTCLNFANPGKDSDYETCLNLLSNRPGEFLSNLNKNDFKSFWKKYKVAYTMYSCSKNMQNFVDVKYYLYDRNDLSKPIGKGDPFYLEYSFALDEDGWRIKGGDNLIHKIGLYCESQPRVEKMTVTP